MKAFDSVLQQLTEEGILSGYSNTSCDLDRTNLSWKTPEGWINGVTSVQSSAVLLRALFSAQSSSPIYQNKTRVFVDDTTVYSKSATKEDTDSFQSDLKPLTLRYPSGLKVLGLCFRKWLVPLKE